MNLDSGIPATYRLFAYYYLTNITCFWGIPSAGTYRWLPVAGVACRVWFTDIPRPRR